MKPTSGRFLISLTFALGGIGITPNALCGSPGDPAVLYVGDSISDGLFGATIDQKLRTLSSNVTTLAWCGATPATWMHDARRAKTVCGFWEHDPSGGQTRTLPKPDPSFSVVLGLAQPRVTVIQLGTNIAAVYASLASGGAAWNSVKNMMEMIKSHHSQCIWIGPPPVDPTKESAISAAKIKATSNLIQQVATLEGCTYVDTLKSIPAVDGTTLDGIHPAGSLGPAWAAKIEPQLISAVTRALNGDINPSEMTGTLDQLSQINPSGGSPPEAAVVTTLQVAPKAQSPLQTRCGPNPSEDCLDKFYHSGLFH